MSHIKSIRVLVTDDMPTMRNIIEKMLRGIGHTDISTFENGQTAYDELVKKASEGTCYDLIISDWNMPVLDGLGFLKKVRANDSLSNTPFLMVTTISDKAKVIEALKHGVSHYVMKPISVDDLRSKIDKVIEKHAAA